MNVKIQTKRLQSSQLLRDVGAVVWIDDIFVQAHLNVFVESVHT